MLHELYWDPHRRGPRKGITPSKPRPGDLRHRLPIRIQQLEKTYDLQSVSASQLISLLGDEFADGGELAQGRSQGRSNLSGHGEHE